MHKPNSIFEAARQVLSEASFVPNAKAVASFQKTIDKMKPLKGADDAEKNCEANRAALQKVLDLYKKGKLKDAYKVASDLDTSVRDDIQADIFDEINS
jgi:hypothetical protein